MSEQNRIEEAARTKEAATATLYRDDGSKRFGDAEHEELMASIRAEHARAFDAIDVDVARKVAEAREAQEQARGLEEMAYYRRRGTADAYGLYAQGAYGTPSS